MDFKSASFAFNFLNSSSVPQSIALALQTLCYDLVYLTNTHHLDS